MAFPWLFFALAANFGHAVTNVLDQLLRRHHVRHDASLTVLWMASFFFVWLALAPFIGATVPEMPRLIAALAAGFMAVMLALPYYYTLSVEEASKVIPIWQLSSIAVLVMSVVFLKEHLLARHYLGFFAMFLAGLLLAVDNPGSLRVKVNRAVLITAAASLAWAVYLILVKYFYMAESFWNGFFWISVGNFLGTAFLVLLPKNFKHLKSQLPKLTKGGVALLCASTLIFFLAELSSLFAVKSAPVALVSVVGGTHMVFLFFVTVLISKYFPHILKENIDRKALLTKAVAISLMLVGLYFVG